MTRLLLPAVALLAAIWASRVVNPSELGKRLDRMDGWIRRYGPWAAAALTVLAVWWTWGHVRTYPTTHVESSYLLQARIFADFAWTAPTPPMPEFFEQPYVLVIPAVASKFPPGHPLLLSVGALLHFLPLVPLIMAGVTAALILVVGSRALNPYVALLAWLAWLTTPMVMRFQSSYFAEPTATCMVLVAWWCLLRWRARGHVAWIVACGVAAGWSIISEPVTGVAFGLPILGVVVVDAVRGRRLEALAFLPALGAVLAIIPLWSAEVTGDRSLTPTALYRAEYVPFDRPGFTIASEAPRRSLTPVMLDVREQLLREHEEQELDRLPMNFVRRVVSIAADLWQGAQLVLIPFVIIGLFAMPVPVRLALSGAGLLLVGRIAFAQDPRVTLPYLAIAPVIAAIAACGLWRVLVWAANGVIVRLHVERRPKLGSALVALVLAFFAVPTFSAWRLRHHQAAAMREEFDSALMQLPSSKSIIFLKYASQGQRQHLGLVENHPDLQRAPVWVVHDLGIRDRELQSLAQDRTAYVFDEQTMEFRRF
ncbi:MAG TPA: hypothetical protein VJ867_09685 [Gemmatimonadaceae bacterium]|nr:hypothetical protein [Gemmatimonadaceae bacterium]